MKPLSLLLILLIISCTRLLSQGNSRMVTPFPLLLSQANSRRATPFIPPLSRTNSRADSIKEYTRDSVIVIYKHASDTDLTLKIIDPPLTDPAKQYPAIVFFFGGSWVNGTTAQFEKHAEHYSRLGMVAILVNYRVASRNHTTPFDAVMDARSAMRYIRGHARQLHIDPDRIIGAGGSAGGHLAAATATLPGLNDPADDTAISPAPNALVLFNPVIDNGPSGFGYAKVSQRYKEISPIDNISPHLPPTIIFLGTADQVIPVATARLYQQRMLAAGNRCELFLYKDQKHGFFNYNPRDLRYYDSTVRQADSFLTSLGYLNSPDHLPASSVPPNSPGHLAASPTHPDDAGADSIVLYSGSTPDTTPVLTAFLPAPATRNGAGVIICPGGSYRTTVMQREGYDVAHAFNAIGVTAFVLKYRLPATISSPERPLGPLHDAQEAILYIRRHAHEWDLDPQRIGIMGFSAGGHLASLTGTSFDEPQVHDTASISLRPDFMILVYPVISFEPGVAHEPSVLNLLGPTLSPEQRQRFSTDERVTAHTPPTLLFHASDDRAVPVENSLRFYSALNKAHVPAELHIFYKGDHGFLHYPAFADWFAYCRSWLLSNGFLTKTSKF